MPNCTETKQVCGKPCTMTGGLAYYKDCKTGHTAVGKSYEEVRNKVTSCAGLTGETLKQCQAGKSTLFPGVKKIHPISKIKTVKPIEVAGRVVPGATRAGKTKNGEIIVPVGSRFDNKQDNWKDTEKLLGDPTPDDDPNTVGGFEGNCFGIPIPCPLLAIGVGAVIVLIVALR